MKPEKFASPPAAAVRITLVCSKTSPEKVATPLLMVVPMVLLPVLPDCTVMFRPMVTPAELMLSVALLLPDRIA
jgi:hypothetical protein